MGRHLGVAAVDLGLVEARPDHPGLQVVGTRPAPALYGGQFIKSVRRRPGFPGVAVARLICRRGSAGGGRWVVSRARDGRRWPSCRSGSFPERSRTASGCDGRRRCVITASVAQAGVVDGRTKQDFRVSVHGAAIAHWRGAAGVTIGSNLAALHAWLRREHGYEGSLALGSEILGSGPFPPRRCGRAVGWRRPPGAQAQVDWAEFPGVVLGHESGRTLLRLVVTLLVEPETNGRLGSTRRTCCPGRCARTACFRRLGGVPAVLRIDNVKTAIAKGAGAWG